MCDLIKSLKCILVSLGLQKVNSHFVINENIVCKLRGSASPESSSFAPSSLHLPPVSSICVYIRGACMDKYYVMFNEKNENGVLLEDGDDNMTL